MNSFVRDINDLKRDLSTLSGSDITDIVCCLLLIGGVLYSPFVFTLALVMMVVRILFVGKTKDKIHNIQSDAKPLLCLLSVYILNIIGMLWTKNLSGGLFELNHKLPFLILPLFFVSVGGLKRTAVRFIFYVYLGALTVGILWGLIHYWVNPYADTRLLIPTARNISFGLNLCFALSVMVILAYKNVRLRKYFIVLSVLFTVFIFTAQLVSGMVTLGVLVIFGVIYLLSRKNKILSFSVMGLLALTVTLSCVWLYKQYDNYFTPKENAYQPTGAKTQMGNTYRHLNDNFIENGYYVNNFACPQEVNLAWKQRTGLSITDKCEGKNQAASYRYCDIIYRYLNSKGLKKDYAGVMALSDKDIQNIKQGYSNYIYAERFSVKPRLYQTFYEFERFLRTSEVEDMSIVQRLFWSKNAINVIKQNPVIGTGTGDTKDELIAPVIGSHPELCTTGCNPHNQFIYITAAFGILGLCVMLFYMLYLPLQLHLFKNKTFIAFFIVAVCWMFCESSFESYEGMTFLSGFMSFFCINEISKTNQ